MTTFLFSFFAIATLVSQTAMDVGASLLTLYFLWKGFRWRQQESQNKLFNSIGFDWIFLLWIAVVVTGVSLNSYWYDSTLFRTIEFKWIIYFYILSAALIYRGLSEKFIWPTIGVVLLCSGYAIAVYFLGYDPIHPDNNMSPTAGTVRTGGFLGNPMTMAHSYGILLGLLWGVVLMAFRWRQIFRWPLFVTWLVLATSILLTLTRGAWIAAVVSTLMVAFLYSRKLFLVLLTIWGIVVSGLYAFWPSFGERISGAFEVTIHNSERLLYWKNNFEMWKDHPILGIGIGENTARAAEYYSRQGLDPQNIMISHAHNQYLNYLTGTGVLGLLCYLFFLGGMMLISFKTWNAISHKDWFKKGLALGCIGAQMFFIIGGLTESNFEHSKVKYMMTLVWGILIWLAYECRVLRHKA